MNKKAIVAALVGLLAIIISCGFYVFVSFAPALSAAGISAMETGETQSARQLPEIEATGTVTMTAGDLMTFALAMQDRSLDTIDLIIVAERTADTSQMMIREVGAGLALLGLAVILAVCAFMVVRFGRGGVR